MTASTAGETTNASHSTTQQIVDMRDRLLKTARYLTHYDNAEDLVQDTIMRALEKQHLFREDGNPNSLARWLFTVMVNINRSALRSQVRAKLISMDDAPALAVRPTQLDQLELDDLKRQISALPIFQQECLHLIGVEDLHYQEATDILGIRLGTVKSRVSRARTILRDRISEDGIPLSNNGGP